MVAPSGGGAAKGEKQRILAVAADGELTDGGKKAAAAREQAGDVDGSGEEMRKAEVKGERSIPEAVALRVQCGIATRWLGCSGWAARQRCGGVASVQPTKRRSLCCR
ncbi:hypothetical protein E2562_028063 [Oryza meyeriana var. granulata]|uniref:Uncharacterized protein n=1 Tax=Oryza meyeriana var. granulata TaxID=110450 RepID=A0A6G1C0K0_9ORYZ|nr:hypothetical protein E2562_028063 [Oryza meyeriana var. granulata]